MESSIKNKIHPTSIVDPQAHLGEDIEVGPFSIIEAGVQIGDGCRIASHVLIAGGANLGKECNIHKGAVIGTVPQDLKFDGEESVLIVGDRTTIREYCTLNRGTAEGGGITQVGSDCLLMAYSHVAHDCKLGNHVILANGVNMAGHVTIEDFVIMGGLSVIHQFAIVGQHAFIGGHGRISQDVPPYIITIGDAYNGLNSVGLRRRGFTTKQITPIKHAYRLIYRSKLTLTNAVEAIKSELEQTEEIRIILEFIEHSKRGLVGR